jgi:hypothetical protein
MYRQKALKLLLDHAGKNMFSIFLLQVKQVWLSNNAVAPMLETAACCSAEVQCCRKTLLNWDILQSLRSGAFDLTGSIKVEAGKGTCLRSLVEWSMLPHPLPGHPAE